MQAARAAVGKQNAGFYRYKVGDIEVTVVTDGVNRFKFAGQLRDQREARRREGRARGGASCDKDLFDDAYTPIV